VQQNALYFGPESGLTNWLSFFNFNILDSSG
jgi:hypothetical protein